MRYSRITFRGEAARWRCYNDSFHNERRRIKSSVSADDRPQAIADAPEWLKSCVTAFPAQNERGARNFHPSGGRHANQTAPKEEVELLERRSSFTRYQLEDYLYSFRRLVFCQPAELISSSFSFFFFVSTKIPLSPTARGLRLNRQSSNKEGDGLTVLFRSPDI